jgi:uncharacterized protein
MRRLQKDLILKDLPKKIVFLVGPRQVGKTWLAKDIAGQFEHPVYLNYDNRADREIINAQAWREKTELLILDELHKMPEWKQYLKGVFDTRLPHLKIIVTGSARLDLLRQAGDSPAGRFFTHRLLPLSVRELEGSDYKDPLTRLLDRGGFPEPFLAGSVYDAQRWRNQYVDGLIREDILDFEKIHDLRAMQVLLSLLQGRVGSPVSYASLAREIGISLSTVIKYIQILEALYIIFRITPYTKSIARSLLKEPKIYFFDSAMTDDTSGARLENCIALSLLKHVYGLVDYRGETWNLHYIRTKEGREVDFCLVHDERIDTMIECKVSENQISPQLFYFHDRYDFRGIQVVQELRHERKTDKKIEVRRASEYLKELLL